jgi:hypothetical protein
MSRWRKEARSNLVKVKRKHTHAHTHEDKGAASLEIICRSPARTGTLVILLVLVEYLWHGSRNNSTHHHPALAVIVYWFYYCSREALC